MNRKQYYFFGIALLALSIIVSIWQNILYMVVGGSLFTMESFTGWFIMNVIVALTATLILLKYYHDRKYTLIFWIAVVSLGLGLCQQSLFYLIISGQNTLQPYYLIAVFLSLASGVAYGIALAFSKASERIWLKRSGIAVAIITSAVLALALMSNFSGDLQASAKIQKAIEWLVLFGSLIPVMWVLNFQDEVKSRKEENAALIFPRYAQEGFGITAMATYVFAIGFGFLLSQAVSQHLYWQSWNAEETRKFIERSEQKTFTSPNGETLKYLLLRPKNFDVHAKYPLVVCLPYHTYECPPAQWLANETNQQHYPAYILVPFCPEGAGWGGIPNHPTIDTLVFDAIADLEAHEQGIDPARRYVTGVSRGGYGSWHFITTRPDMFAAAMPVCGAGNPELANGLSDVAVWAFHGALDRNVPVSGSRNMIEAMKLAGGSPRYTEFPDKAHSIWYEVSQTPGVCKWLFEQKRNSLTTMN